MNLAWKIFRIANIVQIVMSALLFVALLATLNLSEENSFFLIGITVFAVGTIIVTANCINNIRLLRYMKVNGDIGYIKNRFFWLLAICFILWCSFLSLVTIVVFSSFKHSGLSDKYATISAIISVLWLGLIALNGLYIFIKQLNLNSKIKIQEEGQRVSTLVSIGSDLNE